MVVLADSSSSRPPPPVGTGSTCGFLDAATQSDGDEASGSSLEVGELVSQEYPPAHPHAYVPAAPCPRHTLYAVHEFDRAVN